MLASVKRGWLFAVIAAGGCGHYAPPGSAGSWLVAAHAGIWYQPNGPDAGGGEQLFVYRAVAPHIIVGGRLTGMIEPRLKAFGERDGPTNHADVGPAAGAAASWSRLSAVVSAGPVATRIEHDGDARWTVGLGTDAGISVHVFSVVSLGVHAFANWNAVETALGAGLRFEGSFSAEAAHR